MEIFSYNINFDVKRKYILYLRSVLLLLTSVFNQTYVHTTIFFFWGNPNAFILLILSLFYIIYHHKCFNPRYLQHSVIQANL